MMTRMSRHFRGASYYALLLSEVYSRNDQVSPDRDLRS